MDSVKGETSVKMAVEVWLWTLSAISGGDISKTNIKIIEEKPYLDANIDEKKNKDCSDFKKAFESYLKCVIESVKGLAYL